MKIPLLRLLGFVEELPLDYTPKPEPRDLRPPYVVTVNKRRRLVDRAIMEPIECQTQP